MSSPQPERNKVFISYSHKDKAWLERLQVHLRDLERRGLIERWDDTRIQPGSNWREEIKSALNSAKVAVLLISADFIASDFIAESELPQLLAAAETEGVTILPLIINHSLFDEKEELAYFQTVNSPDRPLEGLTKTEQEFILVTLSKRILTAINKPSRDRTKADEVIREKLSSLPLPRNP